MDDLRLASWFYSKLSSFQDQNTVFAVAMLVRAKISVAFQRNGVDTVVAAACTFGLLPGIRCDVRIRRGMHNRTGLAVIANKVNVQNLKESHNYTSYRVDTEMIKPLCGTAFK